jgi:hypothetical protein
VTDSPLALADVLRTLAHSEATTSGALAKEFHVTELDVHVLMLTAQANRLVYRMAKGEWAITDNGRQVLRSGRLDPSHRDVSG